MPYALKVPTRSVGIEMYISTPINSDKYMLESLLICCIESLRENKVPEVTFDIRHLSAKQISIIRDSIKRYDDIEETSSMYETEYLKIERKKSND